METVYVGIDLHASQLTLHQIVERGPCDLTRQREVVPSAHVESFLKRLPEGAHVCVEASTASFTFARMAMRSALAKDG